MVSENLDPICPSEAQMTAAGRLDSLSPWAIAPRGHLSLMAPGGCLKNTFRMPLKKMIDEKT